MKPMYVVVRMHTHFAEGSVLDRVVMVGNGDRGESREYMERMNQEQSDPGDDRIEWYEWEMKRVRREQRDANTRQRQHRAESSRRAGTMPGNQNEAGER